MSNELRAAIIAVAQSAFPVMVFLGVNLSDAAIAAIMLVITNTITLLALLFPGPPKEVETIVERVVEIPRSRQIEPGGGGRYAPMIGILLVVLLVLLLVYLLGGPPN